MTEETADRPEVAEQARLQVALRELEMQQFKATPADRDTREPKICRHEAVAAEALARPELMVKALPQVDKAATD